MDDEWWQPSEMQWCGKKYSSKIYTIANALLSFDLCRFEKSPVSTCTPETRFSDMGVYHTDPMVEPS